MRHSDEPPTAQREPEARVPGERMKLKTLLRPLLALTCTCFTRTMEPAIVLGGTLVEMSLTYV